MGREDRVWTLQRAREEGVAPTRLTRGPEFVRVVPGCYVERCWRDDLLTRAAAVLSAAPTGVLSHWTALAAHGLPVPTAAADVVHIVVPSGGSRPRWPGVVTHRSTSLRAYAVDGLRTTGAVRAWCDTAALVAAGGGTRSTRPGARGPGTGRGPAGPDLADLVAAGDVLLARRPGMRVDVSNQLTLRPGGRGTAVAASALSLLDARAESPPESRVRLLLRAAGPTAPAVQHEVVDERGRFVARVDLAYPEALLAVEYDGDHHRDRVQWRRDLARREALEDLGWRVIVVTARDLSGDPSAVVARVGAALAVRLPA